MCGGATPPSLRWGMSEEVRDLVVVGAGPAGLAVAIAARKAGLDCEVLEKGALVNSIFNFPRHMTFFTTPDLLEIGGLPFVTPYEKPTQAEALRYYRRVADTCELEIALRSEVLAIRRQGDGFLLSVRTTKGEEARRARQVAWATGYYDWPNRLGVPGEDLPHVSHYYTEPHAYYRQPVVVVGGKNSAAIAALELHRAGARVTLVHRRDGLGASIKYWIKPDLENRIKDGAIAARFDTRLVEIRPGEVVLEDRTGLSTVPAAAVFLLTGYHPDVDLLRDAGAAVDSTTLKPVCDPDTLETTVPGFYVAGAVVSGRETSRIFIENGRFHGEAIVKSILLRRAALTPVRP
jgi:thioredoxin reductase (NADPH)